MRLRPWCAALAALALGATSCADAPPLAPAVAPAPRPQTTTPPPAVRFAELHYDNAGTDEGEAIELSGPAGTSLAGWSVVLYNGSNGAPYDTRVLAGTIPATCDARGVVVLDYPANGIQNGAPDGMALVNASGAVVEFLSWEGTFTAVGGPADGITATDIGAEELGTTPIGQSLQRTGAGSWLAPAAATFGACNDLGGDPPPPPPPPGDLPATRLVELHYDNAGADVGEAIEVEGPAGASLAGWSVVLYNGNDGAPYDTRALAGAIPATCDARGVVVLDYPANGIQNGSPDGVALVDGDGEVVEFLSWEGTFTAVGGPADGLASTDIGVEEGGATPVGQSLQRDATGAWRGPAAASFGACNGAGEPPPPPGNTITIVGRDAGQPLPVGFQDQLFANVRDGNGAPVTTTITWTSETPAFATVDALGNVTAIAAGPAVLRATAEDGTTATFAMPIEVAVASATAAYGDHLEFGAPADDTPGDEYRVARPQYVASWNRLLGRPNWVAYNLEASHLGPQDRCDCFTPEPQLPADFPEILTSDYTNSGYSRGHLVKSADRTAATLDNAVTFYFSNIIPQTAANNGGAWLQLENELSDLARDGDREIYVLAGGAGSLGTLKNEGKVSIPASTWKIAVLLPRDRGLADVDDPSDLEIVAIDIPNATTGVGGGWASFRVSVDSLERLTGYDFLALLPDAVEAIVEAQAGVRNEAMDVQPATLSLSTTAVVNVVLLSRDGFDAAAVDAAALRLVVNGGAAVAPALRGTAVNTAVRDLNGDGRPDRLIGFPMPTLRAAGLAPGAASLVLRPAAAPAPWEARDLTPPVVVP